MVVSHWETQDISSKIKKESKLFSSCIRITAGVPHNLWQDHLQSRPSRHGGAESQQVYQAFDIFWASPWHCEKYSRNICTLQTQL